jgi:diguanylate cyclase (GGDEF)-like protein
MRHPEQPHTPNAHDATLAWYLDALEGGDLDALAQVWEKAGREPTLEQLLHQFNADLLAEQTFEATAGGPPSENQGGQLAVRQHRLSQDLYPGQKPDLADLVEASYDQYRCSILVVDDEPAIRDVLQRLLAGDFEVLVADSVAAARQVFAERTVDIVLTDQHLPDEPGTALLEWVRTTSPRTFPLLMTAYFDPAEAIEAFNRGRIFYYLRKPWDNSKLLETLKNASRAFLLEWKNRALLDKLKELNMELEEKVKERTLELVEAIHELHQKNQMLERLAMTDPLTGLPNRRALDHLAERELLWRKRSPGPLALGLIDIDHFKEINSAHRWMGGDRVLTVLSRSLTDSVREVDYLGRYGGEEFLFIAPQTDETGARILAERIRRNVEELRIPYRGEEIRVTVSIGVAVAETDAPAEVDPMRDVAERALAEAKQAGRNRAVVHTLPAPPGQTPLRSQPG